MRRWGWWTRFDSANVSGWEKMFGAAKVQQSSGPDPVDACLRPHVHAADSYWEKVLKSLEALRQVSRSPLEVWLLHLSTTHRKKWSMENTGPSCDSVQTAPLSCLRLFICMDNNSCQIIIIIIKTRFQEPKLTEPPKQASLSTGKSLPAALHIHNRRRASAEKLEWR